MLPDWIDADSWEAFREMRKKARAPMTPYAEKLIVKELVKLKSSGEDPQACLNQSIMNGWRDVFPLRDKGLRRNTSAEESAAYLRELAAHKREDPPPEVAAKIAGILKRVS